MIYILMLLLIPLFFVGIVMYTATLLEYISTNNLDVVLLLIGLFATIISSFFILKEFSLIETKRYKIMKLQKKVDSIIGLISFSLLLFFGIVLIINAFKHTFSYPRVFIGIGIILLYLYVLYALLLQKKQYVFTIKDITKMDDYYMILLYNDKLGVVEYYTKNKDQYKKNKLYKVEYNITSKNIVRILNEVIEVKDE